MEIVYKDKRIVVAVKPSGVLSTDEPGGMPELLRNELQTDCIRTVHRLDQVVSGLMVFARSRVAASELSRQVREREFEKEYLALVHGVPEGGELRDLLLRENGVTRVVSEPGKDVQEAILRYSVLRQLDGYALVRVKLLTGRTHQIRVQLAHAGHPLLGDRKYGVSDEVEPIRLWSCRLAFIHPETGEKLEFYKEPEWEELTK